MDRIIANFTVNALQNLVEVCQVLAAELPADRQVKVEKLLARVRQSKAGIMAEMM